MKFRFRPSNRKRMLPAAGAKRKALRLKGIKTLRVIRCKSLARNYAAEDFGRFDETNSGQRFGLRWKRFCQKARESIARASSRLKRKPVRKNRVSSTTLAGILCGAFCVALFSAAVVLSTVFLKYNGPYTSVTVPDMLSMSIDEATALQNEYFEYVIIYKSNPEREEGIITAQSPLPNVTRKLYSGGEKIKLTLTVNAEQPKFKLPALVGTSLREALILLKGKGISAEVIKEYSDSVEAGKIISCSLPEGSSLKSGDVLVLRSSLGRKKLTLAVPELSGLSENDAISALETKGFSVGDITYEASKAPLGTVISQSVAPNTSLTEKSKISFTVSGGLYYYD